MHKTSQYLDFGTIFLSMVISPESRSMFRILDLTQRSLGAPLNHTKDVFIEFHIFY